MENTNRLFIAEVKKKQAEKKLTYKDISKKTGYKRSTIGAFMCGARDSDNVKDAIANALEIKHYYRADKLPYVFLRIFGKREFLKIHRNFMC